MIFITKKRFHEAIEQHIRAETQRVIGDLLDNMPIDLAYGNYSAYEAMRKFKSSLWNYVQNTVEHTHNERIKQLEEQIKCIHNEQFVDLMVKRINDKQLK